MADTFKGIITADGKKRQLPYGNVLETPVSDKTLEIEGAFADSKEVGERFAKVNETTDSLKEEISTKITKFYASSQGETHLADSDNGKIMDMMLYGKSSQDGTPTPENPVEIKSVVNPTIKICGKNLFDSKKFPIILNRGIDTNTGAIYESLSGNYCATEKYIPFPYSGKKISFNASMSLCAYDKDYKFISSVNKNNGQVPSGTMYVRFDIKTKDKDKAQIELSENTTTYEPYKEQTIQLPITLNAIPVSSGGNVTIDGQQYIADYVDVEREKVVRMCENVTFNGAENENWTLWNENEDNLWSFMFQNSIKAFVNESASKCNRFEFNANESTDRTFWLCNPSGNPSLQIKNRIIGKDITAFKSWLSNNPIDVIYLLRIPIEEELTAEHAQALKELATYYPVTNISISSEQLDGYTVFNYPISMANGWNYVKQQLNDNRDYIYDMDTKTQDIDTQSAEAYVNSEYAVALTELEV